MKIVINISYNRYELSSVACDWLKQHGVDDQLLHYLRFDKTKRNHPKLVECVESLGKKANARLSELKILEIPDDVQWEIKEYAGSEWIAEKHRTWM